jgi:hypothetical protein
LNDEILNAIDEEIARLRQAHALLADAGTGTAAKAAGVGSSVGSRPRRNLSAKARQAIAEAQHRRWAKVKGQKKPVSAAGTS